ncbi:hypothetical protein [Pseudomonas lurida]|uniref:hypothetical protein n=1 Tax=Pseudomonas lurida TaxID=244566 RepID=UPI001647A71A|nr:hypothetical protein [Pseudomonas lurida]MBC3233992.1 hypothetical protein [Pseudomonas lurida]
MNAAKTIAQMVAAQLEVNRIVEPYMQQMIGITSCIVPTMTVTRHEGHVSIATSYPPEVQGALDRIQAMCREAVHRYLEREGFTMPCQEQ